MARSDVVEGRADDALDIYAGVCVEALVLDGDRRLDGHRGYVFQLHCKAVVAMVADVGQDDLARAVGDQRVARERRAVQPLDRRQAVKEGLRVGVRGQPDHEEHGQGASEAAQKGRAAHLLADRRPRGVDPRARAVPRLCFDSLRYVSSHGWRRAGFYAFQHLPTAGKGRGLRRGSHIRTAWRPHPVAGSRGRAYTSSAGTKRSWRVPGK